MARAQLAATTEISKEGNNMENEEDENEEAKSNDSEIVKEKMIKMSKVLWRFWMMIAKNKVTMGMNQRRSAKNKIMKGADKTK